MFASSGQCEKLHCVINLNSEWYFVTGESHSPYPGRQRCCRQGSNGFGQDGSIRDPDYTGILLTVLNLNLLHYTKFGYCQSFSNLFTNNIYFNCFKMFIAEDADGQENGPGAVHTGPDPCSDPRAVETNPGGDCKGEKQSTYLFFSVKWYYYILVLL